MEWASTLVEEFLAASPSVHGCTVAVASAGEVVRAGGGWMDATHRRPMPVDATMRIASCTKTFTAATVLRLAEQGRLALDNPIADVFAAERDRWDLTGLTFQHLLQHTSGLPDMDGETFMATLLDDPDRVWTAREKVEASIAGRPRLAAPGPPARYCDVGYVLLALAVERLTRAPLHEAFRHYLGFERLGLASIHVERLEPTPPTAGLRLRSYLGERDVTDIDASCDLWGAGGLVSDAADLALWWHALFAGEIFERSSTLDVMLTSVPEVGSDRRMGLGLYVRDVGGRAMWAHGGSWGSYVAHTPSTGRTASILLTQWLDEAAGSGFSVLLFRLLGLLELEAGRTR